MAAFTKTEPQVFTKNAKVCSTPLHGKGILTGKIIHVDNDIAVVRWDVTDCLAAFDLQGIDAHLVLVKSRFSLRRCTNNGHYEVKIDDIVVKVVGQLDAAEWAITQLKELNPDIY